MPTADTIAAISTPAGSGAIAMIRLSGPRAFGILGKVFKPGKKDQTLSQMKTHTNLLGTIHNESRVIDEVVVNVFRSPNSYTGEDLLEITCHGSVYIQQEILALLIRQGARLAHPGEYTQRAFLNGKMDLSQAEAVADLIASSGKAAHQLAMKQMRAGFSKELDILRVQMLQFVSLIELELDFAEEDVEFADRSQVRELIEEILVQVNQLIRSFELGNAVKNGIPVAIVGETNTGKSTLLNTLLKEDKAIVSDIAGTTRDIIEDVIHLEGIEFRFIDTAGLRHTDDTIENLGIERSFQQIDKARIVLLVTDPTAPEAQSQRWVSRVAEKIRDDQHLVILVNKTDRNPEAARQRKTYIQSQSSGSKKAEIILISAKTGSGLDELISTLLTTVNLSALDNQDVIVTNVRHFEALEHTREALDRALNGLSTGISGEFLAQDIREALGYLGEINGTITTDEILGNIFKNFCIGK